MHSRNSVSVRALAVCALCLTACAQTAVPKPTPALLQWDALLPQVKAVIAQKEPHCPYLLSIDLTAAEDVTGDDNPTALVDFCQGGASTDEITVMQLQKGQPVLASFLDGKGKRFTADFVDGGSAMHSDDVKLVAATHAIYTESSSNNSRGLLAHCSAKAYVWNPRRGAFAFDAGLSRQASQSYCIAMRKQLEMNAMH